MIKATLISQAMCSSLDIWLGKYTFLAQCFGWLSASQRNLF